MNMFMCSRSVLNLDSLHPSCSCNWSQRWLAAHAALSPSTERPVLPHRFDDGAPTTLLLQPTLLLWHAAFFPPYVRAKKKTPPTAALPFRAPSMSSVWMNIDQNLQPFETLIRISLTQHPSMRFYWYMTLPSVPSLIRYMQRAIC